MYKAPINFTTNVTESIVEKVARNLDEQIYSAIQKCGVEVNKDELIRALQYDRDQYNAGYEDGVRDTMEEVPRWIPVTERLPEDDESLRFYDDGRLRFCTVLTYQKSHGVQISNRLRVVPFGNEYLDEQVTNGWKWSLGAKSVTHWMPIPDAPKDGE